MTAEQIRALQQSFDRLWPVSQKVTDLFYGRLFAIAPDMRVLFPSDMEIQKAKFIEMMASVIGLLERPDMFTSSLTALGERHVRYKVQHEHYAVVGDALLWTLETVLSPDFDDDTKAAWSALYQTARDLMTRPPS